MDLSSEKARFLIPGAWPKQSPLADSTAALSKVQKVRFMFGVVYILVLRHVDNRPIYLDECGCIILAVAPSRIVAIAARAKSEPQAAMTRDQIVRIPLFVE